MKCFIKIFILINFCLFGASVFANPQPQLNESGNSDLLALPIQAPKQQIQPMQPINLPVQSLNSFNPKQPELMPTKTCDPGEACCDQNGNWLKEGTPCDDGNPATTGKTCNAIHKCTLVISSDNKVPEEKNPADMDNSGIAVQSLAPNSLPADTTNRNAENTPDTSNADHVSNPNESPNSPSSCQMSVQSVSNLSPWTLLIPFIFLVFKRREIAR